MHPPDSSPRLSRLRDTDAFICRAEADLGMAVGHTPDDVHARAEITSVPPVWDLHMTCGYVSDTRVPPDRRRCRSLDAAAIKGRRVVNVFPLTIDSPALAAAGLALPNVAGTNRPAIRLRFTSSSQRRSLVRAEQSGEIAQGQDRWSGSVHENIRCASYMSMYCCALGA
jgi:hypothetical protein